MAAAKGPLCGFVVIRSVTYRYYMGQHVCRTALPILGR